MNAPHDNVYLGIIITPKIISSAAIFMQIGFIYVSSSFQQQMALVLRFLQLRVRTLELGYRRSLFIQDFFFLLILIISSFLS